MKINKHKLWSLTIAFILNLSTNVVYAVPSLDTIEKRLHERLDGNVVGYQFALIQDGVVTSHFSQGYADLAKQINYETTMRQNLGSVSKIITTVSILKLVDQKKIALEDPFYLYLDANDFPHDKIHDTIKHITIYDLLTHTAQFSVSDCETKQACLDNVLAKPRLLENCVINLESDGSSSPYRCSRDYQNAAIHLLRFIMEPIMYTSTVPELVDATKNLWLAQAGGFDMDCKPGTTKELGIDMRYFNQCKAFVDEEPGQCVDGFWHQSKAWVETEFCSSGGWYSDALSYANMLYLLKNNFILSDVLTEELFSLHHAGNSYVGSTHIGWDTSHTKIGELSFWKGGAINGTRTSIFVGENTIAVLLINSDDNAISTISQFENIVASVHPGVVLYNVFK